VKRKRADWGDEPLLHGTSTKELLNLRRAKRTIASGLFLTDDENTAYEYAFEAARRWGGEPVIVKVSTDKLKKAGGKLWYDTDGDEIILEQMVYEGPLPKDFILEVENLKAAQESTIERIGPEPAAAPQTRVARQHEYSVTDTSEYAAHFLGLVEGNEDTDRKSVV
jgi:hypothetical protein